ncbi:MAG: PEGA domain-containing protein [Methanomicrobiales archaeon]|nr:PEGA domain-containing protein [Methanomicrobiales archaeon]
MKLGACLICAIIALLLACGCTDLQGSTGSVSVSSSPPGSDVYVDGAYHGRTPLVLQNVAPGVHHILLRGTLNTSYETDIPVTTGAIAIVNWVPEQVTVTPAIPMDNPVFSLQNMKGYRGGGDYITSLSYDISLAPGAKTTNMSEAMITLTVGDDTINPYWVIADKKQANTNDLLESDETFFITMRTPRLGPNDIFTLTISPRTGQFFTVSHTLPEKVGLDVKF